VDLATGLAVLGIVLAVAGIALALTLEVLRRPRLEITTEPWLPPEPRPYTLVQVVIRDIPPRKLVALILARQRADDRLVTLEFRRIDREELAVPVIEAGRVPPSGRIDAPPGEGQDAYGVAILHKDGCAYAWSESLANTRDWRDDALAFPRGEYRIRVEATAFGAKCSASFKLDNTAAHFARFQLTEI
jgi:hypothetical protein